MQRLLRRDAPRLESPAWHQETVGYSREPTPLPSSGSATPSLAGSSWLRKLQGGLSWLLICVGLAATVCGGVLLGWTWLGQRPELLIAGLACAAAGQFGLLGGLLIQPPALPCAPAALQHPAHPAAQWLDIHRRIDEILRADLPERPKPE